jgi:hypothetical protein
VQVWSVPVLKLFVALLLNGESLVIQAPPIDVLPNQSKLRATTMPPPDMYASRLSPSVVASSQEQLEKTSAMSYCCNWARVGVPAVASKKSAAMMPGSASRLARRVVSGLPQSADTTNTRYWPVQGVPVGVAVGVGVNVAVAVGVGVDVAVAVGVGVNVAVGAAVGVGVPVPTEILW